MGLIHLYSATSTSFDGNGTPLVTAREAVVKRDEGFQLTFSIPISQNELHKRVQKEMLVSAMTPDGVNYFRIWDIEKRTTDVKVTALQLLYSLDVKQINPFGGKQYTGTTILQAFVNSFKSSISPYTFSSSINTARDFYTNEEDDTSTSHNALAILNKITDSWSGELMLTGFDVRMISKLGTKTDALLYEHKNIASFSDSSSMNGIVTRIYATATYTPERAEGAEEDPEPVVLTATVDSPLIDQYAVVYEATMEYNDARTVAELRTEILKQYSEFNVDKPERTIDVDTNIVDGTAINFGDELVLKYLVHDVDEVIRCVGYEYDPISENYIGVMLGTLEKTFLTKVSEGISSSVTRQLDKLNKQIQIVQTAANGKNRVTYGPNPVPNAIEGDLWFKHPEGRPDEIELLIYQNGLWLPAPFLTDQDKSAFEQEVADYQNAVLAEVALKDQEYKEIFDAYDEKVVTIDQGIADAATKANSALEEAGISTDLAQTAKDLATTAQANVSTAISDANQAKEDALAAVTDASQAKTSAQTAIDNAQLALAEAVIAKTTANNLSIKVDELEGEVELKANSSSVNTLTGRVSTAETTISQHATSIASKASQTEVDTVKGTVSGHTTTLSQHATSIASKASTSSVNTLTGRVSTAESNISQNATAISARLTSSQVNSLVDGKGFSTVTYVDNQINATADSFGIEMTRVESEVLTQVGGRNLAKGTSGPLSVSATDVGDATDNYKYIRLPLTETIVLGQKYTISFFAVSLGVIYYQLSIITRLEGVVKRREVVTFPYNRASWTFTATSDFDDILIYAGIAGETNSKGLRLNEKTVKVEKGSIMTDWSPAPEDALSSSDFTVFKNSYQSAVDSINAELSKTAKITDLNGMVTETTLATKQFVTAGSMSTTLNNYLKTSDLNGKVKETVAYQDIKETTDRYTRVIGSTDAESRTNIAQIAMTDSIFQTKIYDLNNSMSNNLVKNSEFKTFDEWDVVLFKQSGGGVALDANAGLWGSINQTIPVTGGLVVSGSLEIRLYGGDNGSAQYFELNALNSSGVQVANRLVKPNLGISWGLAQTVKIEGFELPSTATQLIFRYAQGGGRINGLYRYPMLNVGYTVKPFSVSTNDKADQSQVTQLANSWALTLKSGNDIKTQINASTDGIRLASKFIHLSGTSLIDNAVIKSAMIDTLNVSKLRGTAAEFTTLRASVITAGSISADRLVAGTALVDRVFVDTGAITQLTSKTAFINNIKAISIDVGKITGNTASFISAGFTSLNSQSTINGHAIRIQNTAGEFVEMNNTPELRSDDASGTAVVLGRGRVHFYDSRGHSKGYVGTDMHTAGSYDFGTFLSKGSGIYKFARMADATQTTYAYYTVKAGKTAPSSVITDMVINGYLPDGNAQQFVAKGNMLSQLNGWPNYPNWPALSAGQQIRYKELTSQTTGDAYEDIWKFGPSSQGDWRIYFAKHATFEGGYTGTSDRRLKHDIETTQVEALHHIESLTFKEFKWNRDNKYEPLGLIAQDSGIIRVSDDTMEGIDIQRAIMLGLKGVQELQEIVKEQAAKIKQLEEINNQ